MSHRVFEIEVQNFESNAIRAKFRHVTDDVRLFPASDRGAGKNSRLQLMLPLLVADRLFLVVTQHSVQQLQTQFVLFFNEGGEPNVLQAWKDFGPQLLPILRVVLVVLQLEFAPPTQGYDQIHFSYVQVVHLQELFHAV